MRKYSKFSYNAYEDRFERDETYNAVWNKIYKFHLKNDLTRAESKTYPHKPDIAWQHEDDVAIS